MRIAVRPARPGDLQRVLELLDELREGATPGIPWERPEPERALATWKAMLEQPGRTILVAEADGEPIGVADLIVVQNLTRGAASIAYVENVAVASAHRRQGAGRALMAEAEARAREAVCYKLQLLSYRGREGAHRFYRSLEYEAAAEGFRRYL